MRLGPPSVDRRYDDDGLIADQLARSLAERLRAIENLLEQERILQAARHTN